MIPPFDQTGYLPQGTHLATLQEIRQRFAYNDKREKLFEQLSLVSEILRNSNCPEIYLNGRFVTSKEEPADYDMCWEPTGVTPTDQLRLLLQSPQQVKKHFLGDIRPRISQPPYHIDLVEYWQTDVGGDTKGIIRITLRTHHD